MRWTKRPFGTTRTTRRFAMLATEMSDGTVVWLEWYWARQVWQNRPPLHFHGWWYTTSRSLGQPITQDNDV